MISTKDFEHKQILFVLLEEGEKVSFKNDNIIILNKEGKIKHQSTCYLLFALFVSGHICVTSGLLERAKKFGFSIIFMSYTLRPYAMLPARAEGNVILRRKQYEYQSFELGAHIISNKIHNQNAVLKKIREKSSELKKVIVTLEVNEKKVLLPDLKLEEIMGLEGTSARIYFGQLFKDYDWKARRPRVKQDMINCLLDIGYSLLFNLIDGLLEMYGFDTYVGILHREFFNRKSLVCDMVEPFRAIIDNALIKALNLGQCNEKDFFKSQNQWMIGGKKAAPYITIFIHALLERKNEIFLYIQTYYRSFMRNKPVEEYPVFLFEGEKVVSFPSVAN